MTDESDIWRHCSPRDRQVIGDMQQPTRPVPADELLGRLRQRYRDGGAELAVIDGTRRWTYAEFGEWVFGLAGRLVEAHPVGRRAGRTVLAVTMDRSAELVAAVQAVALAGAAYCPISPADPPAWRRAVAELSGAVGVLVAGEPAGDATVQLFDEPIDVTGERSGGVPFAPVSVTGGDAAQVLFTSGSTGRPKGVICTHRGFANRIRWMQEAIPLGPADRVALKTPTTFDVAGWELFWPQYAGAQTVVVPPDAHRSPEALTALFNEHGVTVAHFVPSMLRLWLRAGGARRCPDLRAIVTSGEALDADLVDELRGQSSAELHNLYGPTEAAIDVTHFRADTSPRRPVPIGRPISNTHIYVLDAEGAVCPVGVPGEIYIHGVGVAAGYLAAAGADAARFAPVPGLPAYEGWGTFRTGDAGRYADDGQIEFLGRLDDQVKIRGQRVELGEIEAALRSHSSVSDACARLHRSPNGQPRLLAYAVLDAGHPLTDPVGTLTAHLMDRLPARAMPSRIILVDAIPLNAHGKADRSRLPEPGRARPEIATPFAAPGSAVEALIAGIWAEVIDLDEVGVDDDFHEIGGDSLAAVEISFLIAERLGLDHDDDLVAEILVNGGTVARSARIVADRRPVATPGGRDG